MKYAWSVFAVLLVTAGSLVYGEARPTDTVSLGNIKVVSDTKTILIPAYITRDYYGLLEYMGVTSSGKSYESALVLQCDPLHFHAAMLLINAKAGELVTKKDPVSLYHTGDVLEIDLLYQQNGETKSFPLLELAAYRNPAMIKKEEQLKKDLKWVFTGSRERDVKGDGKMVHMSSVSGSLISLVPDRSAEVNLSRPSDVPYRGPDFGYVLKRSLINSIGKENYTLRIRRTGEFYHGPGD